MNAKFFLTTSLIVGALTAVLSSIPIIAVLNCLLCGWLWLGGIFGVWLYRNFTQETLSTGRAALLGLVSGLIGAVIATIIALVFTGNSIPIPPEQMQQLEEVFGESAQIFTNTAAMTGITAVVNLITYPIFTAIGGLIGAAVFKPKASI